MRIVESLEARRLLASNLVADFHGIYPTDAAEVNGISYFAADDGVHGKELWKSDGTSRGTRLVADIVPGATGSEAIYFFAIGDRVVFFARHDGRILLFSSDGSESSTQVIKDLGAFEDELPFPQVVGEGARRRLIFVMHVGQTDTSEAHSTLWASDGTAEGTVLLKEYGNASDTLVSQAFGPGNEYYLPAVNGRVIFATVDGIWSSDGTPAGTINLTPAMGLPDDELGGRTFDVRQVAKLNGLIFFVAESFGGADNGNVIFTTDGTPEGTTRVADIGHGSLDAFTNGQDGSDGRFFLVMVTSEEEIIVKRLWVTDGTAGGTTLVHTFRDASGLEMPGDIGGRSVVFSFDSLGQQGHATDLWVSDGTDAGTKVIKTFSHGPIYESPRYFTRIGGVTFFLLFYGNISTSEYFNSLWRTDGTAEGTVKIDDLANIQATGQQLLQLKKADGKLLVQLLDPTGGTYLNVADTLVVDPASVGPPVGPQRSTITLDDDRVLRVFGTRGDDNIRIYRMRNDPDQFVVSLNGVKRAFAFADVRKLIVHGYSGDDAIAFVETNGLMTLRSMIWAGTGDDTIYGDSSRDTVFAEAGDDLVYTGRSADMIDGGSGDDSVYGSTGNDTLNGADGADRLLGGRDADVIAGGDDTPDDHLDGGGGADVIFGNAVLEVFFKGKQGQDPRGVDDILVL